ncbi:MAG: HAD family hydrolase [Defluviitaleaceae bacterium]|nr:HAD family hydrolase [Defluviitaleaceae bacterium]
MAAKMIVCDLDGTLLRTDKTVSPYTLDILHRCRQTGIKFAIATARSQFGARLFTDFMVPDVLIYDGGARAKVDEKVIYNCQMDSATTSRLAQSILAHDSQTYLAAEIDRGYFYTGGPPTAYAEELHQAGHNVVYVDFAKELDHSVHKLSAFMCGNAAAEIVRNFPDVGIITYHGENIVRYAHKNATKWQAIRACAAYFGITTTDITAFGDDYNDIEMLANCGIGVAMANAIPQAKATANHICDSNDIDGVAKWIKENIF